MGLADRTAGHRIAVRHSRGGGRWRGHRDRSLHDRYHLFGAGRSAGLSKFDSGRLYPMLVETASLSGAILLIIGAATGMAWALTQSGFSSSLATMMTGLPGGALTFWR